MTTVAESGQNAGSRARLIWVALALSLTLNVCFVGGLVWSKIAAPRPMTPAERFNEIGNELKLSAGQHESLLQMVDEVRRHTRLLHESNHPLVLRIWAEMAKPQPDQATVAELIDKATENRHVYQKELAIVLGRFLATLTPEQRAQFIEIAQRQQDQRAALIRRLILP